MELESILLPGIEAKRPIVIAGPCSAETEEQVMETAKQLAAKGQKIYRAGIWKPRTKPGGFEGIGVEGLAWLKEVKKETGMYVSTEVATAKHVYECLKAGIDILWVALHDLWGRRTYPSQSFRRTGNCRRIERGRHPRAGKKSGKPRPGIVDRCTGTYQQRRLEAFGSYPPWFQQL